MSWFERFHNVSDFKKNPIYISGQGYGGVYAPLLAQRIKNHNLYANDDKINLAGFLVGNGLTNYQYDMYPATVQMAYYRMMVSTTTYRTM